MMETNWMNELDEVQRQILNNPNRVGLSYERTITSEEFIRIFEARFTGRTIYISYDNDYLNTGIPFEKSVAVLYCDNTLEFYEEDGEVPYQFKINLDNIETIEIADFWLDHRYPEDDMGAIFNFLGNDGFSIEINAEK